MSIRTSYKPRKSRGQRVRQITLSKAKKIFIHRFTMEHVPTWALEPMGNGMFYAPQYKTDKEWHENSKFYGDDDEFTNPECRSENMSWPLGKSLPKVFTL